MITKEQEFENIKFKVKEYAIAALPGLLSSLDVNLDVTLSEKQQERNIANKAFAIGLAMAEVEQEIFQNVDRLMTK